jgi:hypothetical protein
VEIYIPFSNYRGIMNDPNAPKIWVPLDPSFKVYEYIEGVDLEKEVPFDPQALLDEVKNRSTINEEVPYITSVPQDLIEQQMQDYENRVTAYIEANMPEVDTYYELEDALLGKVRLKEEELGLLPSTLPYKVITKLEEYSEIPNNLRHKIKFEVGGINYTLSMPEIAGKRITLSYKPATEDDEKVMNQYKSIIDFPVYLVEQVPVLKVEGETKATGVVTNMGSTQEFAIEFIDPTWGRDRISNMITVGEYYGIGLRFQEISPLDIKRRLDEWRIEEATEKDDLIGEFLYINALMYFCEEDIFGNLSAKGADTKLIRYPSECMVGVTIDISYLFQSPHKVKDAGLGVDVDRDIVTPFSETGDKTFERIVNILNGMYGSVREHYIFENLSGLSSVSATKLLQLANNEGIPIYTIDAENIERINELNVSSRTKNDVRNFINAGKTVIIPQRNIQYIDYKGVGYIAIDLETGEAAYMISGGLAGGKTAVSTRNPSLEDQVKYMLNLAYTLIGPTPEIAEAIYIGYKLACEEWLRQLPSEVVKQPNEEFNQFVKGAQWAVRFARFVPWVRPYIGLFLLHFTLLVLMATTLKYV